MSLLVEEKLEKLVQGGTETLTKRDLTDALSMGPSIDGLLARAAHTVLLRTLGPGVCPTGIIEISNSCQKNCLYCGLRRGNSTLPRYHMTVEEIVSAIENGWRHGIRSFLLQSGELLGEAHAGSVVEVLRRVAGRWGDEAGMVLSIGELPRRTLEELGKAGAHRYLLRIETSEQELYNRIHPKDGLHRFGARLQCLADLGETGWQVGSGVLVGVPWQTVESLASDLLFLRDRDIDMCGFHPWIEHSDSPLAEYRDLAPEREARVRLTLRMTALLRLMMPDIDIYATTALQMLDPDGPEKGLLHGANVLMPGLTPSKYRLNYRLFDGRTAVPDDPGRVMAAMTARCSAIGRKLMPGEPGDPLHYIRRILSVRAGG
ncbi:[FeFe] hydrogenase H-cluster radical SAM maturase HydE [Candidatus Fermentibacteria bacterium]|nr:[FeFe] hydrogenase H-cluster radical SAM maturase HydE [Candidatus Fermentibacteria bacterium]